MAPDRLSDAAMLALAGEVAALLGDGWQAVPDPYAHDGAACLVRADGAVVFLGQVRWPPAGKGRLSVTGRYPRSADGKVYGPTGKRCGGRDRANITVSIERGPEAIARDIASRFLPGYLDGLTQTQADIAEHVQELRDAERAAICIAAAAGVAPERWAGSKEVWCIRTTDGLIKVRDSHRGPPHIEVRLDGVSVADAEKIARVYRPLGDIVREVFGENGTDKTKNGPRASAEESGRRPGATGTCGGRWPLEFGARREDR